MKTLVLLFALFSTAASANLFCVSYDTDEVLSWHLGEAVPDFDSRGDIMCLAWGPERQYIERNFTGIPVRDNIKANAIVTYRGDDARFILDNI